MPVNFVRKKQREGVSLKKELIYTIYTHKAM
jgi:hypothetical protein